MAERRLRVTEADDGMRLDRFLAERVEGLGRAGAKRLFEEDLVRVEGRRRKRGERVAAGEEVSLLAEPPRSDFAALPDPDLPLAVVYEDQAFVAVAKAAGVPSHPLLADERGTVASALVARYPEMAGVGYGPREPGILHRLDTDTSGLLLAARTPEAFAALRAELARGGVDKRYLALGAGLAGRPRLLDWPIANDPGDKRRVVACTDEATVARLGGAPASTEVLSVERLPGFSFVEVRASWARRHQVRAHLAAWGCPLAGDALYGGPALPGLSRHFLHASRLDLAHPVDGRPLRLEAALPVDLEAVLDALRTGRADR